MTKSLGPAECAPTPKAAGDAAVGMTKSLEMTKSLGMTKSAGILLHSPPLPPLPPVDSSRGAAGRGAQKNDKVAGAAAPSRG